MKEIEESVKNIQDPELRLKKKLELMELKQEEIRKDGKLLDGNYEQVVDDKTKEPIYDKNGNKLEDNYRKVISDTPSENLYDKKGRSILVRRSL